MSDNEFVRLSRELTRIQFAQRFAHPFIVFGEIKEDEQFGAAFKTRAVGLKSWGAMLEEQQRRNTMTTVPQSDDDEDAEGGVLAVVKSARNPYSDRISVGRSRTSDIVLGSSHVSKLHAHILPNPDGTYDIRDAGSSNGTFRNGVRLKPDERVRLRPGDKLRFGWLDTLLLDAGAAFDWIRAH